MNKSLVLYHDHCTDGFGAAFAARLKLGDENTEYLPVSYGQVNSLSDLCNLPKKPIDEHTTVYILDFSLPRTIMDELFENCKQVIWLDHHKTAFELYDLPPTKFVGVTEGQHIELDNERSGAMISWNYFFPETEAPMFIKHIDDRDRWQFKIPGSKEFHAALASYKPWSFEQWMSMFFPAEQGYPDEQYDVISTEGVAILRAHEQNVQSIVGAGRRECVLTWEKEKAAENDDEVFTANGLAANCPPYAASDVGHELANRSGTFGLCWYMGRDGKAKVSLRSNGDYDVSVIAKAFGGGGHKNSAGFEIDMKTLMGWMK